MPIRAELPDDIDAIHDVTVAAFKAVQPGDETEAGIVAALRAAGALTVSLVVEDRDRIIGHVALSPVRINGKVGAWYGLGPVSVQPDRQGEGFGQALVRAGLEHLRALSADGCVVLGDPAYYGRFGFAWDPGLTYGSVRPGYFQRLVFRGPSPVGNVTYHDAFGPA